MLPTSVWKWHKPELSYLHAGICACVDICIHPALCSNVLSVVAMVLVKKSFTTVKNYGKFVSVTSWLLFNHFSYPLNCCLAWFEHQCWSIQVFDTRWVLYCLGIRAGGCFAMKNGSWFNAVVCNMHRNPSVQLPSCFSLTFLFTFLCYDWM